MADKGMTLAIVLLIAGLAIGGGIGYFAAPTKVDVKQTTITQVVTELPLKGKTIKLGYIESETSGLETSVPWINEAREPDMNAWAKLLGHDTKFDWQVDDATGQANIHLEKVQGFKSMGITIFHGGGWSSQAQAALNYVNSNNMLMWSSSSTSPLIAVANDRLYRMCPCDGDMAPALADAVWKFGIKAICFVQRGDSWGDGIKNLFYENWTKLGGKYTGDVIRYEGSSTEFANYLQIADQQIGAALTQYGEGRVGGVLLSFSEAVTIVTQAGDFPNVLKIRWFGMDGTAKSQRIVDDAGVNSAAMGIYSLYAAASATSKYNDLEARYIAICKQPMGSYTSYGYDLSMITATQILTMQSDKADTIVPTIMSTCENWFGAGGWCKLNAAGDRVPPPFDFWGYALKADGTGTEMRNFGYYNLDSKECQWWPEALGYTPLGP